MIQEHIINGQKILQVEKNNDVYSLAICSIMERDDGSIHLAILNTPFTKLSKEKAKVKGIMSIDVINDNTALLYKMPGDDWEEIFGLLITNLAN